MKILIALSSEHAEEVLYTGVEFARLTNSSITILNVIKNPGKRAKAQKVINWAVSVVQNIYGGYEVGIAAMKTETKIRVGHPAEEIIDEANKGDYSLIVVGTWPKQNLLHRLLAPTTERIVTQVRCPVLIAKGKLTQLRHILLCVSGADTHSKAATFLTNIVNQMNGDLKISVIHVMSQISASPYSQDSWQLEASAEKLIEAATPEGQWLRKEIGILSRTNANIQPRVRHGLVVDELLMETLDSECDLLVIGAYRQAGWQRLLLDDLSHQIMVRADRPILVV